MAYATPADLRARAASRDLRELTDDLGEVIDDGPLARAIHDASAEIDGYLVGRYALPLAAPPAYLTVLACDLAYYRLLGTRAGATSEDARKRYEDAVAYLRRVGKGELGLGGPETGTPGPAPDAAVVVVGGGQKVFGRAALGSF